MDSVILGGLVKRLYPNFSMREYDNRFKIQKAIFLMRRFGLDLGYSFNLYLNGPYCPDLTRDAFQIPDWNLISEVKFDVKEKEEAFIKFQSFFNPHKDEKKWLEIASTLILINEMHNDFNKEKTIELCQSIKKELKSSITRIYETLEEDELI